MQKKCIYHRTTDFDRSGILCDELFGSNKAVESRSDADALDVISFEPDQAWVTAFAASAPSVNEDIVVLENNQRDTMSAKYYYIF